MTGVCIFAGALVFWVQLLTMNNKEKKILKWVVFSLLLAWFGFLMAEKIDLVAVDLGRHIENGKWVAENHFNLLEKNSPVHENFYSYTNPDFPVPNHHWGSGVIFFGIYKMSGFSGLSVFYILLVFFTFSIFFYLAKRESNFTVAVLLSIFLLPLIAERWEIRPEIFSCFFAAVFLWLLWKRQKRELAASRLSVLPILMALWVNLHVYFFLGLFLIGVFWIAEAGQIIFSKLADIEFLEKAKNVKNLTVVGIFSALAALANPFGWKGLIYPFGIFRNYGYTIVENKSVGFVESYGIANPNFFLIKTVLIVLTMSFLLSSLSNHKKISFEYVFLAVFFGVIGWIAIRNFTLLGFFALPILAANFENIFTPSQRDNSPAKESGIAVAYIFLVIVAVFASWQFVSAHSANRGLGIAPNELTAAEFLRNEKISGPVFNNYDIGSYLIFAGGEKVFVDNRPEAYPAAFFEETYKPMQSDEKIWKEKSEAYGFNAVIFYRNDITPWGTNFLKNIIPKDENWAKVFENQSVDIFLKRDGKNSDIIEKYEIVDNNPGVQ